LIIYQQVRFFRESNLGFNKDNVVVVQRAYALQQNKEAFKKRLLDHPGISHASFSLAMPGRVMEYFPVQLDTLTGQEIFYLNPIHADHDFLETMQMYLIEGTNFSNDSSCMNSLILNQAALSRLGLNEPLGQVLHGINSYGERWVYSVVGVVRDYNYESLHSEIEPLAMVFLDEKAHVQYLAVRIKGDQKENALDHIQETWQSYAADEPFDYYFLESDLDRQYHEEETTGQIFSIFSFLAILIAALGLFGLATHTAEQRTKEISIRKAMGASGNRITLMLSVEFARWVLWASILAVPLAYAGMKFWLSRFAFHINIEAWFFLIAAFSAFIIALVTVSYQAVKSARANPVHALQYE
jgi:putative ABC transport system permease protein